MRAVRWSASGEATLLPRLRGHRWSLAWGINKQGVVSGWSRKLASDDGENNPVIWTRSGKVKRMKTPRDRADGAAEATTPGGLTVGYLGNLGTERDPESDQAAVWSSRRAKPRLLGPRGKLRYAELVDVNDRGYAIGMAGKFTRALFPLAKPVIWRPGWKRVRAIPVPAASRKANPVIVTMLNDVNAGGTIVGDVFGLGAKDPGALRRIDPVVWNCRWR